MATTTSTTASATRDHETYPVAELFYSFQGEGVNLGRRALFVRFMRCNLTCGYRQVPRHRDTPVDGAMRCDTEYTWNGARHSMSDGVRRLTPPRIWAELMTLDPSSTNPTVAPVDLIVVSGGEPLLHQAAVLYLAQQAAQSGREMEVETNATISPGAALVAANVAFNASIKLASSAVPRPKRIKPAVIQELHAAGRTRWKFVVTGPDDLDEIAALQTEFALTNVWLSPEGCTATAVIDHMRMVADAALTHGWNLTTRQHVLIWGGDRGR